MSRYTTYKATYRIVTPMFCAGADQTKAELRLPSVKGALRFWWRTLQWGEVKDEKELWKKEAGLFGSSDKNYGQSKVRMQFVGAPDLQDVKSVGEVFERGELQGMHYLGYGVMEAFSSSAKKTKAGQLTRPMIPGGTFTIALRCGPNLSEDQLKEIEHALILLGTVGGIGAKSRKGYGSLTITKLEKVKPKEDSKEAKPNGDFEGAKSKEDLKQQISNILSDLIEKDDNNTATEDDKKLPAKDDGKQPAKDDKKFPNWTAWSKCARVVLVWGYGQPLYLLDKIGCELVHYRSWGNNGKVLGHESERNFKADHDLSKGQHSGIDYPVRVAFGLPHNYGKGSQNSVEPKNKEELGRRASPLFFHVHQISEKQAPIAILTFLPSLFLPPGEKLRSFGVDKELDRSDGFWNPIHGYLNRLLGKKGATSKKDFNLKAEEVEFEKPTEVNRV